MGQREKSPAHHIWEKGEEKNGKEKGGGKEEKRKNEIKEEKRKRKLKLVKKFRLRHMLWGRELSKKI